MKSQGYTGEPCSGAALDGNGFLWHWLTVAISLFALLKARRGAGQLPVIGQFTAVRLAPRRPSITAVAGGGSDARMGILGMAGLRHALLVVSNFG